MLLLRGEDKPCSIAVTRGISSFSKGGNRIKFSIGWIFEACDNEGGAYAKARRTSVDHRIFWFTCCRKCSNGITGNRRNGIRRYISTCLLSKSQRDVHLVQWAHRSMSKPESGSAPHRARSCALYERHGIPAHRNSGVTGRVDNAIANDGRHPAIPHGSYRLRRRERTGSRSSAERVLPL